MKIYLGSRVWVLATFLLLGACSQFNSKPSSDEQFVSSEINVNESCENNKLYVYGSAVSGVQELDCQNDRYQGVVTLDGAEGSHLIFFAAGKPDGSAKGRKVVIDKTPPEITVLTPEDGTYANQDVVVEGNCENRISLDIQTDVETFSDRCHKGSFSFTLPLAGDDRLIPIVFSQTDRAGNVGSVQLNIIKDTTAPELMVNQPVNGSTLNKSTLIVAGTCESGLPVIFSGTGLTAQSQVDCVENQFNANVVLSPDPGSKEFSASQTDRAGNTSSQSVQVELMLNAPKIAITAPAADSYQNQVFNLQGTCDMGLPQITLSGAGLASPSAADCAGTGTFSVPVTLTPGDGNKTVVVSQTSLDGITGSDSRTFKVDRTAPVLTVNQPLEGSTTGVQVSVSGQCERDIAVVIWGTGVAQNYSLDCNFQSYTGQINLMPGDGEKLIQVSQTDAAGNFTTIDRKVNLDSTAPQLRITAPTNDTLVKDQVTLTGTCETDLEVAVTGAGLAAPTQGACSGGAFNILANLSAGDGSKLVTASQTDAGGNSASASVTVIRDTTAPVIAFATPDAGSYGEGQIDVTGTCEAGIPVVFSGTGHASPAQVNCENGAFAARVVFSAGQGEKIVEVSQTDTLGNRGSDQRIFNSGVKPEVPVIAITNPAEGSVFQTSVDLNGTCTQGLNVVFNGDINPVAPLACDNGTFSQTLQFSAGDGLKNVVVSQTNSTQQTGMDSRNFVKDSTPPALSISNPAEGALVQSSVMVNGSCEEGLEVRIAGNGLAQAYDVPCLSQMFSQNLTLSNGDGSKAFSVMQTDLAGNSSQVNRSVVRDTTAPILSFVTPEANSIHQSSVEVVVQCESGLNVSFRIGAATPVVSACAANQASQNLRLGGNDGTQIIEVSQADEAGNSTSITRSVIKDTQPPTLSITNAQTLVGQTDISVQGVCEVGLEIQVSGTGVAVPGPVVCQMSPYQLSLTLTSGDGDKEVRLMQTDAAGNSSTVSQIFTLDTTPPMVKVLNPAEGSSVGLSTAVSGACESGLPLNITGTNLLNPGSFDCSNSTFEVTLNFATREEGKSILLAQTDAAGNTTSINHNFTGTTTLDGASLYTNNCSSCHGPLENSAKRGRTAEDITNAIARIGAMSNLRTLTAEEIQAISDALNMNNGGGGTDDVTIAGATTVMPTTGGFRYVASTFESIFRDKSQPLEVNGSLTNEGRLDQTIQNYIHGNVAVFGDRCHRNDTECDDEDNRFSEDITVISTQMIVQPSAIRKGYGTRACHDLLRYNEAVDNAVGKIGANVDNTPSQAQISQLYDLFNPGYSPSAEEVTALQNLVNDSVSKGQSTRDQWRYLLLPLCLSIGVDMI